jgi:hypothetical protein
MTGLVYAVAGITSRCASASTMYDVLLFGPEVLAQTVSSFTDSVEAQVLSGLGQIPDWSCRISDGDEITLHPFE